METKLEITLSTLPCQIPIFEPYCNNTVQSECKSLKLVSTTLYSQIAKALNWCPENSHLYYLYKKIHKPHTQRTKRQCDTIHKKRKSIKD